MDKKLFATWEKNPRESWLTVTQVKEICPPCAEKMEVVGMMKIRFSQIAEKVKAHKIEKVTAMIKSSKLSKVEIEKIKKVL